MPRRGPAGLAGAVLLLAAAPLAAAEAPPGATSCLGCHGRADALIPALRGQRTEAIAAAMREYRTGARPATLMDRIAKGFTEAESEAIAAWIAAAP